MFNTKLKRTSLIIVAVVLMLSVFSMTAFAEETELANDILAAPADEAVVAGAEDSVAEDVANEEVAVEDVADEAADEEAADETADEDKTTETVVDDDHDHDAETTGAKDGFGTSDIVSLIILGIVVIAIAAYCIVKREKVGKYFRSIKSEFKKIVWSPRDQVRKNTIVVIVVVVALAAVIALADLVFMKGITALSILF